MELNISSKSITTAIVSSISLFHRDKITQTFEKEKEILILSYVNDFQKLWKFNENNGDSILDWTFFGDSCRTILVVWDGLPTSENDPISVSDYVTPYDWALACSVAALGRATTPESRRDRLPELRILILDLQKQRSAKAFGRRTFISLFKSLPWIQIYNGEYSDSESDSKFEEAKAPRVPVKSDFEATDSFRLRTFKMLKRWVAWIQPSKPPGLNADNSMPGFDKWEISTPRALNSSNQLSCMLFDLLNPFMIPSLCDSETDNDFSPIVTIKDFWKSSLITPATRHQIGNLLSPKLLCMGFPLSTRSKIEVLITAGFPLREALFELATVVGMGGLPENNLGLTNGGTIADIFADECDILSRRKGIKFFLIDDNYALGYQHILGFLLFGDKYQPALAFVEDDKSNTWNYAIPEGQLVCEARTDSLFKHLGALPKVNDWQQPRILKLPGDADILFLDLRVWDSKRERAIFFKDLIDVIYKIGADKLADEADASFDPSVKAGLEQARKLSLDESTEATELAAICLLPLFLSHYDPSLPIILFSSTQQRAVIELVSHRRNIITTFSKPIFDGYDDDSETPTPFNDLVSAIGRAIDLHELRYIWERIVNTDWKSSPVFEVEFGPKGNRTSIVYNSTWHRSSQIEPPKLSGNSLKNQLANYYVRYLQSGAHFDFASIPFEMLEGCLIPEAVQMERPSFNLDQALDIRNYKARALQNIRNKKAHGNVQVPKTYEDRAKMRLSSILIFSIFLDFIEDEKILPSTTLQPIKTSEEIWGFIKARHRHLYQSSQRGPQSLTGNNRLDWLDFVVYTVFFYSLQEFGISTDRCLSQESREVADTLARFMIGSFWTDLDEALSNAKVLAAEVVERIDLNELAVKVENRCIATLREPNVAQKFFPGDSCTVLIKSIDRYTGTIQVKLS